MPTELKGSCHCGAVKFTVQAFAPVPYQICVCRICTKTCGQGGAIPLGASAETLKIEGEENINIYRADTGSCKDASDDERFKTDRQFCKQCSTMLLISVKSLPGLVFPFASAIDSELLDPAKLDDPQPLTILHADNRLPWAHLPEGEKKIFAHSADENLEQWHKRAGVWAT